MSNNKPNRQNATTTSVDISESDKGNDASSINPLYLATTDRLSLTRPPLTEISSSSHVSQSSSRSTNDENLQQSDREKKHERRRLTTRQPGNGSHQPMDSCETTLERPDTQTWDRHATAGNWTQGAGSPNRSSPSLPLTATSGTHVSMRDEESPSKSNVPPEAQQTITKPMQARSIRLSLGASAEITIENRLIPHINCQEKIILCLDVCKEMESMSFRRRNGKNMASIDVVKKALGIFFQTKHMINPLHEFALMFLDTSSAWMCDFTNNPNKMLTILEDMTKLVESETCDLSSIFDEIKKHVEIPCINVSSGVKPPYVVRVILIYGRSNCIPHQLNRKPHHKAMEQSNCFCIDVLYIHDPPSAENNCEKIFDVLCDLDDRGTSYVLEVSKNPTKVYDCMAQLLAHPLQRCLQQDVSYILD